MLNTVENQMRTLKEQYGSETSFTRYLANNIHELNKVNDLLGLPHVVSARNELPIPGGSIDVVGYTLKGECIVYEHQDQTGRADQTHVGKTSHYARVLHSQGLRVLGAVLLCETIDQIFLDTFEDIRWAYNKRPSKMGHCNVNAIRSQWTDEGVYAPARFDNVTVDSASTGTLDHYKDFYHIYARDWTIQREERNGAAVTLWHRIGELDSRYMAWIHTLKGSIKVGLHCLQGATDADEQFLRSVCPQGWTVRRSQGRATIETQFPTTVDHASLADATETLKRNIRKHLLNI